MYGWFEPGGGVNKYFSNTQMIDVLLRTVSLSNNIVLGNACNRTSPAALYVSHNSVGVKRIPDPLYSLDVSGNVRFDENSTITCGDWFASSLNTGFSSNLTLTNQGLADVKVVVADEFKKNIALMKSVRVVSVTVNIDNTLSVQFEATSFPDVYNLFELITETTFLFINKVLYKVNEVVTYASFVISSYFGEMPFPQPFQNGDIIDVQVCTEYASNGNTYEISSQMISWFTINSYIYLQSSLSTLTMTVTFMSSKDVSNMFIGERYSLGLGDQPINVLKLVSFSLLTPLTATLVLKTIDQQPFPMTNITGQGTFAPTIAVSLILLDTVSAPIFEDLNVSIGTYTQQSGGSTNTYILLSGNSRLSAYMNPYVCATCAMNEVTISGASTYDVISVFQEEGHVLAKLADTSASYAFSIKGAATYQLNGIPFQLTGISQISESTGNSIPSSISFRYDVIDLLKMMPFMKAYIGQHMYFAGINVLAQIKDVVITVDASYFVFNTDITHVQSQVPTYIYLVPFKAAILTQLGKDRCYIQTSLAINTMIATETLTVGGSISLSSQLLFKDVAATSAATSSFPISYSSGSLTFGSSFQLSPSNATFEVDTIINGTVLSEGYLSFSDSRIKKHIRDADPLADLELIKQIQVKDFLMKTDGAKQKGIIAQDLAKIIPSIVHETTGYIPSICKDARITSIGSLCLRLSPSELEDVLPGKMLKLLEPSPYSVEIISVRKKKGSIFIKTTGKTHFQKSPGKKVYIIGPWSDNCKVVDKDYLFMVMLNAFKAVVCKLDALDMKEI